MKEVTERLQMNQLLENAASCLFPERSNPANVQLEAGVALESPDLDGLGHDLEKTSKRLVDYLLLTEQWFSSVVLNADSEVQQPLVGNEQGWMYTWSQHFSRKNDGTPAGRSHAGKAVLMAMIGGTKVKYPASAIGRMAISNDA